MNTVFTLLLNIFITAIGYLSVPVLLCISGKKYPLSKLKKIVIINGIVFWLIFSIISINAGNEGFGASVVLWSGVAYFILKKWCLFIPEEDMEETTPDANETPSATRETAQPIQTYIPIETQQQQQQKKSKTMYGTLVLSILLLGLFICTIAQCVINADLNKQIEELEKRPERIVSYPDDYYKTLEKAEFYDEVSEKVEFYDEAIVFVIEGYGDYYFTYDEMIEATEDEDEYSYWAYNKEQAISRGYTPYYS